MIELVVAIIAIMVVLAGLLQIILLSAANTDSHVEAIAEAAARASSHAALAATFNPLADWNPGADGYEQTRDDTPLPGSLADTRNLIAGETAPDDDWSAIDEAAHNQIAAFHHGMLPSSTFGLVSGKATRSVEVLPIAATLFGLRNPTEIENEVWMTKVDGLY